MGLIVLLGSLRVAQSASNITLEVHEYDPDLPFGTGPLITSFTYLVNVDNTGDPADPTNLPSLTPMASYSPIAALGDETTAAFSLLEAGEINGDGEVVDGRYLISVRAAGYKLGGTHIRLPDDAGTVVVELVADPLPLAQIQVHAFHDNRPVNGEDDAAGIGATGFEEGLEGFRIILDDVIGEVSVDWYGNPLCTQYERDVNGDILFDISGAPIISLTNPNNGGVCYTDENGDVTIENLARGKYEVLVVPPDGQENDWVQTTTIEGTHVLDAWVVEGDEGNSPREGLNQAAVWVGFVQECTFGNTLDSCNNEITGTGTVSGTIKTIVEWTPPVNSPPASLGEAIYRPWIALTDVGNTDEQVYLGRGDEDGNFLIENVPDGLYQMAIWDDPLDYIISFYTVQIPEPAVNDGDGNLQTVEMGEVGVPRWFGWLSGYVYMDDGLDSNRNADPALIAGNGLRDCVNPSDVDTCEQAIDGIPLGTRFRDGSLQYGTFTDNDGYFEFPEVFELEKFAVIEVDFGRLGRTGIAVHDQYDPSLVTVIDSQLGGDLLASELTWAAKRSWIDFGKSSYSVGESGGISGIVYFATTRNEIDVRFAGAEDYEPGIPGVTVNLYDASGTQLLYSVETDSFVHPTGCDVLDANGNVLPDPLGLGTNCIEVPNISNEVKDGAFDGGYAFEVVCPGGYSAGCQESDITPGDYVVEVVPLPFYKVLETTDQNTSEGNELRPRPGGAAPIPLIPAPTCSSGTGAACARRFVTLHSGQNAAADFFLLPDFEPGTVVPPPGRILGFALDDLNVETDPNRIYYGEKRGIPNTPIGIRDFTGRLIAMVNSDINGIFEVLVPSSYAADCPTPSGVCPNVYKVVVNDPGDIGNPTPNFNPNYQSLTFQFDVWPGKTTYADVATFAITTLVQTPGGYNQPAECGLPADVPEIHYVNNPRVTIPMNGNPQLLTINGKGFGNTPGKVIVGSTEYNSFNGQGQGWSDTQIKIRPNNNPLGPQQLLVEGSNGQVSPSGLTVHLWSNGSAYDPDVVWVDNTYDGSGGPSDGGSTTPYTAIQDAIDAATDGSLIVVRPGSGAYFEDITLNKAVWLQGFGPGALDGLGSGGSVLDMRFSTQALTINAAAPGTYSGASHPVLDGFRISNSRDEQNIGGGLYIEANGEYAIISNNIVQSNGGNLGGALVVGQPYVGDNNNDNIRIHHNRFLNNGGISRAGAIGIYNGADNYRLDHNDICGNYSGEYGGGISHFGLSTGASIDHNRIYYNSAFDEGGGVMIAGEQVGCTFVDDQAGVCVVDPAEPDATPFTTGSGAVDIHNNLIQANLSNDDGGGIRLLQPWDYAINIMNNMIVNNVATDIGGGISLDDASIVTIVNNTVANNASTATAEDSDGLAHGAGLVAEPYSTGFSNFLNTVYGPGSDAPGFPDPVFFNNIVWNNVAYTFVLGTGLVPPGGVVFDIEVLGGGSFTGDTSNHFSDPLFVDDYVSDLDAVAFNNEPFFITVVLVTNYITPELPGDYHLISSSPVIDAGAANVSGVSAPGTDFDDEGRVAPPDVGADEYAGTAPMNVNTVDLEVDRPRPANRGPVAQPLR